MSEGQFDELPEAADVSTDRGGPATTEMEMCIVRCKVTCRRIIDWAKFGEGENMRTYHPAVAQQMFVDNYATDLTAKGYSYQFEGDFIAVSK